MLKTGPYLEQQPEQEDITFSRKSIRSLPRSEDNSEDSPTRSKRLPRSTPDAEADDLTSPRKKIQVGRRCNASPGSPNDTIPTPQHLRTLGEKGTNVVAISPVRGHKACYAKRPVITDIQCNPTDPSIRKQILRATQPCVFRSFGYFEHSSHAFGKHAQVQRYAKRVQESRTKSSPRKSAVGGNSDRTTTQLVPPVLAFPGAPRVYAVKRELGRGAFAPVYLADSCASEEALDLNGEEADGTTDKERGQPLLRSSQEAVKAESPPSQVAWEFRIIRTVRDRLEFMQEQTEWRWQDEEQRQRALASIVTAHECHNFADEAYLILDYCPGGTLLDLINTVKDSNRRAGKAEGGLDEILAMFFAVEVLRTMEALHRVGILHGDLKADNCLLRLPSPSSSAASLNTTATNGGGSSSSSSINSHTLSKFLGPYCASGANGWCSIGIKLIDFGRGIVLSDFPARVGFIADWATAAGAGAGAGDTEAPEIREARPWKEQIDLWAAAGVIYSLLYGRYLETLPVVEHRDAVVDQHRIDENGAAAAAAAAASSLLSSSSPPSSTLSTLSTLRSRRKKYQLKSGLKRYWAVDVWKPTFDLLLNPPLLPAATGTSSNGSLTDGNGVDGHRHDNSKKNSSNAAATAKDDSNKDDSNKDNNGDDQGGSSPVASVSPTVLEGLIRVRGGMEQFLDREGERKGLKAAVLKTLAV